MTPPTPSRGPAARAALPAAVFAAALALRLVHLADVSSLPTFRHPVMDPAYHDQWAMEIARGDLAARPVFFRAPLYPYLLGLVYAVFGRDLLAARLAQALTGSLSCALVALLARRIFGSDLAGALAGLLAASSWTLIYFDGELLVEPLAVALTLAAILLTLGARGSAARWRSSAAGLALGLAAGARPTVLTFAPVALWWVARGRVEGRTGAAGGGRPAGRRAGLVRAALLGAGLAAAILPVTLHNLVRGGDLVLMASQGGVNFYIGNNPRSDGTTAIVPGTRPTWQGGYDDTIRLAEQAEGRRLKPSEVSRHWYRQGWRFILGSPLEALALTARKAVLFWNAFEIGNNEDFEDLRSRCRLIGLPLPAFGSIAPIGIAGVFLALRRGPAGSGAGRAPGKGGHRRREAARLCALFAAVSFLTTIAFFVNSRYRLPVQVILTVFAGGALAAWIEALRALRRREASAGPGRGTIAASLVAAAAAAPLILTNWLGLRANPGIGKHLMGLAHAEAGRPDRAEEELRGAAEAPGNPLAFASLVELGRMALARDDLAAAEAALRRAVSLAPGDPDARTVLAETLFRRRDLGGARAQMEVIAGLGGAAARDPDAQYRLGLIGQAQGDTAAAAGAYARALALDPDHPEANTNLALILQSQGRLSEALDHLRRAVAAAPRLGPARRALAAALLQSGDLEGARREAREAAALGAPLDPALEAAASGIR